MPFFPPNHLLSHSNLPAEVTEEMVQDFFKDCGTVLNIVLPRHKGTDETRGFAIVMFGTEASVVSALKLDRDPFHGGNVSMYVHLPM